MHADVWVHIEAHAQAHRVGGLCFSLLLLLRAFSIRASLSVHS